MTLRVSTLTMLFGITLFSATAMAASLLNELTPMGSDHFGAIKFGMTVPEASKAAGMVISENAGEKRPSDHCFYVYADDVANVMFMVEKQKITNAYVYNPSIQTPEKFGVGSDINDIKQTFANRWISRKNTFSESGEDEDIIVKVSDNFGYVFFMKGDVVEYYNAGDYDSIQNIEGC